MLIRVNGVKLEIVKLKSLHRKLGRHRGRRKNSRATSTPYRHSSSIHAACLEIEMNRPWCVVEDRRLIRTCAKPWTTIRLSNVFAREPDAVTSTLFLLAFFFFSFSSRHIFHGIAVNTVELVFRRQSVAIGRASSQLIDLLRRPALSRSYLHTQPTTYTTNWLHCTQERHDLIEDGARKRNGGIKPRFSREISPWIEEELFLFHSHRTKRQRQDSDNKML